MEDRSNLEVMSLNWGGKKDARRIGHFLTVFVCTCTLLLSCWQLLEVSAVHEEGPALSEVYLFILVLMLRLLFSITPMDVSGPSLHRECLRLSHLDTEHLLVCVIRRNIKRYIGACDQRSIGHVVSFKLSYYSSTLNHVYQLLIRIWIYSLGVHRFICYTLTQFCKDECISWSIFLCIWTFP